MPFQQTPGFRVAVLFLLFAIWLSIPTEARPAPASDVTGTLLSWTEGQIHLQGSDGRAFVVKTTAATWVLRRGLPSADREFTPGEILQIRQGRGPAGTTRALLVCDPETAGALAAQRGHLLVGTLLKAEGKVWIVQPADNPLPLPVCLSAHTRFQSGQALVTAGTFGSGASITVVTRGLPNGLPSAVSVSDGAEAKAQEAPKRRRIFTGTVLEARPDLGLLTLQDKNGFSFTIAVEAETNMKVRTRKFSRAGAWADLAAGTRVTAHLGENSDIAGNPVASRLSITPPALH